MILVNSGIGGIFLRALYVLYWGNLNASPLTINNLVTMKIAIPCFNLPTSFFTVMLSVLLVMGAKAYQKRRLKADV